MTEKGIRILSHEDIQQKIKRMAYEILENNYDEKELYIIGIKDRGYVFAEKIFKNLKEISQLKIHLHSISLDKKKPVEEKMEYDFDPQILNNKSVILADDVGNTGRTLCYALQPLLTHLPKKIETIVLIDRKHKSFPISADYVGLRLSTTMKEHVLVEFTENEDVAYLT